MVVKKILNQTTPHAIEKEIEKIKKIEIKPQFIKWINQYEKIGGKRNKFIWKIFLKVELLNTIDTDKKHKDSLDEAKFLLALFVVLIDDIVDQNNNKQLFKEILKIVYNPKSASFNKLSKKDSLYFDFILKVWNKINNLIKRFPNYKILKELFYFDIEQIINAMNYDLITQNKHFMISDSEIWLFSPHTMKFITNSTINLMCVKNIEANEIAQIREIAWQAQKMARIGNWITTWQREIKENDFSSGIFTLAINKKIISQKKLTYKNEKEIIKKINRSNIQNEFLDEWEKSYYNIKKYQNKIKSINVSKFLKHTVDLLKLELSTKNLK